jgi:hypothetical protein
MNPNELSFITRGEPKRDHYLEEFVCYYLFHPLLRNVFQSRGNAFISISVFVATKRASSAPLSSNGLSVLLNYSGFQPSYHNMNGINRYLFQYNKIELIDNAFCAQGPKTKNCITHRPMKITLSPQ